MFQYFNCLYSRSAKCFLHIASYGLRIGISIMELLGSEYLISYAFKECVTFLLCILEILLGPFSRIQSDINNTLL